MRRRIPTSDFVIAGAIIGAAVAILLFAGAEIEYDSETGKFTIVQRKAVG